VYFSLKADIWLQKIKDFPENQITEVRAKFPNLCRIWKNVNSAKIELLLPVKR